MAIEPGTLGTTETPLLAAQRIAPLAAELAERIERERCLPSGLLRELVDAGLFSLCLPRALGGGERQTRELVLALEELARGDGATGWCAMIASTSSLLGAYLPPAEAELIFAGGRNVTGGGLGPARAVVRGRG